MVERVRAADALLAHTLPHGSIVATVSQLMQMAPESVAQSRDERGHGSIRDVGDSADTSSLEHFRRLRPHAPQCPDGQWMQKLQHSIRRNLAHAIGLGRIRGELGDELCRPDTDGARQTRLGQNAMPYFVGNERSVANRTSGAADIEKRFVDAEWFDERCERPEDFHDLPRVLLIQRVVGFKNDERWTQPFRRCQPHRTANPQGPGFVCRTRDDRSRRVVRDHGRLASSLRVAE